MWYSFKNPFSEITARYFHSKALLRLAGTSPPPWGFRGIMPESVWSPWLGCLTLHVPFPKCADPTAQRPEEGNLQKYSNNAAISECALGLALLWIFCLFVVLNTERFSQHSSIQWCRFIFMPFAPNTQSMLFSTAFFFGIRIFCLKMEAKIGFKFPGKASHMGYRLCQLICLKPVCM